MSQTRNYYKELEGKLNVTGKNINRIRLEKNLSAQRISDKLIMIGIDIHRQAIYDIESGKRTVADYELAAIAEILEVTPNDLLSAYTKYLREGNSN